MMFDKTKAMRNADRYLAQGKIRSAINEYKQVVDYDPTDFATMNILGDMYAKNDEMTAAIKCYNSVADHYNTQGFAQKAIAIYNKVSRLDPHSIDTSAKLAELYKSRGSIMEARVHYTTLAEYYQSRGKKLEALGIWKEIAALDPTNTDVYLSLAESYLEEGQGGEATEAYIIAGQRLANQDNHEEAIVAFEKALAINESDVKCLAAFAESKFALGQAPDAIERLLEIQEKYPHNRDILLLIVDCQIDVHNLSDAEQSIIRLVELEPANYPKFLEIAYIYLEDHDYVAAARILAMSSEHLLVGGQADSFFHMVSNILAANPEQLEALRLLARYRTWQRDETALRDSLTKLAAVARDVGSIDDERFALSQLVMLMPHELEYSKRLTEINEQHGFVQEELKDSMFERNFLRNNELPVFDDSQDALAVSVVSDGFGDQNKEFLDGAEIKSNGNGYGGFVAFESGNGASSFEFSPHTNGNAGALSASGEMKLAKEIDSISFYIESGYLELAAKAIDELESEFGNRPELDVLRQALPPGNGFENATGEITFDVEADMVGFEITDAATIVVPTSTVELKNSKEFDLNELRSEFGLEEPEFSSAEDYETHYSTAVAYSEMGLLEEAIKEFQAAASLTTPNDGTRRFFSCANLLGHCFMQNGMAKLALRWYQRTLETKDLNEDEKQGLWYEIAAAYEADGDLENAGRYFEQVYAENVNFRDVSERIKSVTING